MREKLFFVSLLCILLLLTGCYVESEDHTEDYKQIAAEMLVITVLADPNGDVSVPDSYIYQWSDDPATDILYMNTMKNKDKNLICEQFYATDGVNVWRGGVIINIEKGEIVDTYSYHVFTSGVTPIMGLGFAFGEVGDTINFYDFYEKEFLKQDYGVFEITERADAFHLE